jgi:hypothetical protein
LEEQMNFFQSALKSKKFTAYIIADFGWKTLLVYAIFADRSDAVILAMISAAGFVQAGYIGGQAWLDRYIKGKVGAVSPSFQSGATTTADLPHTSQSSPESQSGPTQMH